MLWISIKNWQIFNGILWLILGTFIVSHWEKYNTGILFLPWSYDLAQLVIFFIKVVHSMKEIKLTKMLF